MRQNREQLLAKQQILEQYARQQKQQQLQQQQQQQQYLSSKQLASQAPPGSRLTERPFPAAAAAGFNATSERRTESPRYDPLETRTPFRPLNNQQQQQQQHRVGFHSSGSHLGGSSNQFAYNRHQQQHVHQHQQQYQGNSSRSVSDVRMDNVSSVLSERLSFSHVGEQNLLEQYNNNNVNINSGQQLTEGFPRY